MHKGLQTAIFTLALSAGVVVSGVTTQAQDERVHRDQWQQDRDHDRGPAYQSGYRDGVNSGMQDRESGHSFRPTESDYYKHADRGYNSGLGDKNQYKQSYRDAFQRGYEEGYGSPNQARDRDDNRDNDHDRK